MHKRHNREIIPATVISHVFLLAGQSSYVSEIVTYENCMVGENGEAEKQTRIKIGDLEVLYAHGREHKNEIFSVEYKVQMNTLQSDIQTTERMHICESNQSRL